LLAFGTEGMFGSNEDHRPAHEIAQEIAQDEEARALALTFDDDEALALELADAAEYDRLALETAALLSADQRLRDDDEALALDQRSDQ
jgi:hypothetical protein